MTYQREFANRIKVGVVGVGNHCYRNILPVLHYLPVELKAVCDTNGELAERTACQYGCAAYQSTAEMYHQEELDAVILCVSARLHPALAIEAFQVGLHVWMEKPAAMRAAEVEDMMAHIGDRVCVVGFKKAFMPATDKAIETVAAAQFGALKSILAVYPMTLPENGQEVLEKGSIVNWLANGIHPLSFMLAVGGKVESVISYRNRDGAGLCMLQYESGAIGNFHFASGPQPIESYRLFGADWHLTIENSLRIRLERGIPHEYNKTFHYAPQGFESGAIVWEPQNCLATLENNSLFTQGIYGELKHFCDCILEKSSPTRGSLPFTLEVMKIYEAALLSEGKVVDIR